MTERESFDAWFSDIFGYFPRTSPLTNQFLEPEPARAWLTWQAARAAAEVRIAALEARLEVQDGFPGIDGITCRDETIRLQDEKIAALEAKARRSASPGEA